MDLKDKKILTDEINMTDAIPAELQTGSAFALEYVKYIRELKNEFQLILNQVERGQLFEADIDLMCKETLLKNVRTRRMKMFWMFSSSTKKEMAKNRLRNIFLSIVESYLQGDEQSFSLIQLWIKGDVNG